MADARTALNSHGNSIRYSLYLILGSSIVRCYRPVYRRWIEANEIHQLTGQLMIIRYFSGRVERCVFISMMLHAVLVSVPMLLRWWTIRACYVFLVNGYLNDELKRALCVCINLPPQPSALWLGGWAGRFDGFQGGGGLAQHGAVSLLLLFFFFLTSLSIVIILLSISFFFWNTFYGSKYAPVLLFLVGFLAGMKPPRLRRLLRLQRPRPWWQQQRRRRRR